MRARTIKTITLLLLAVTLAFGMVIRAAALDDTYRFDDLGMSVKFPKNDYVITLNTPRGDEVFSQVNLDYDETMTAFKAANIYLRAYDPDMVRQISMTVNRNNDTASINNYADLTSAERKSLLDTFAADESVSSAVEVKRNGNLFIDSMRETQVDGETIYINQCNTVVNGIQIDLTLQKPGEPITGEEAKALSAAASSLSFDHVDRSTGPVFDWWRLLLWAVILAALSIAITVIYRRYNAANRRKLEERRSLRKGSEETDGDREPAHAEKQEPMTFDQSLGYKDDEEFTERAAADEMAGTDIKVRDADPTKGISFFEDEGKSIDDGSDYFDTYFKEQAEKRAWYRKAFSAAGTYLKLAANRTGSFFKNLFGKKS